MTAEHKYSLPDMDSLMQPIQMKLSKKQETVFRLFSAFFKSRSNFERFGKMMTITVYVFPKLQNTKQVVRQMS